MGKATLARQRAQGLIGQGRVDKLYEEGKLVVMFADEYERLKERVAELERRLNLLRGLALDVERRDDVAERILAEAMSR